MSSYTLTLTARQAAEISRACEVLARLQMGQIDMALRELPLASYLDYDAQRMIESILQPLYDDGGKRHDSIAWDLYQVVRHRLAWDRAIERGEIGPGERRRWPEMMGVCYDEPMQRGSEPLARIERAGGEQ